MSDFRVRGEGLRGISTTNFVQRGTDIMLGELNVSQVSHGPCTHLSPFAIKLRRTDSSDIPFWHR